jgi:D-alanyl-D-alanine carboxypeptidase
MKDRFSGAWVAMVAPDLMHSNARTWPRMIALGMVLGITGCALNDTPATDRRISLARAEAIEEIDSILERLVADGTTAGISWAIGTGDGAAIARAHGLADIATQKPLRPTDSFRIASVTKPITAAAVLKLIETQKLSLQDRLSRFFPDYPNGESIKIYQLLSHTAGIPNWWEGELPPDTPAEFPMCPEPHRYLQEMKLASFFKPGESFKYSNSGYVLLGEIIEKASGQTYERFLAENIFRPTGMTTSEMEHIERPSPHWVTGYARVAGGGFSDPQLYHMPFAAGGLRSTALDLLKFMDALLAGKIIPRDLAKQMTTYASLGDGRYTFEAAFVAANSRPPTPQANLAKRGYGLGFNLMEIHDTLVYYHSGGIAGFNSYVLHVPKNRTTVVLLSNTEDGLVPALKEIQRIVITIPPELEPL